MDRPKGPLFDAYWERRCQHCRASLGIEKDFCCHHLNDVDPVSTCISCCMRHPKTVEDGRSFKFVGGPFAGTTMSYKCSTYSLPPPIIEMYGMKYVYTGQHGDDVVYLPIGELG